MKHERAYWTQQRKTPSGRNGPQALGHPHSPYLSAMMVKADLRRETFWKRQERGEQRSELEASGFATKPPVFREHYPFKFHSTCFGDM